MLQKITNIPCIFELTKNLVVLRSCSLQKFNHLYTWIFPSFSVPSAPRHLNAELTQQDPPQVMVTWQKPEHLNGQLLGYKVFWARMGQPYEQVTINNPRQQNLVTKFLGKFDIYYDLKLASRL